jgi:heart-and neural crest derivatives-expressed protein 2
MLLTQTKYSSNSSSPSSVYTTNFNSCNDDTSYGKMRNHTTSRFHPYASTYDQHETHSFYQQPPRQQSETQFYQDTQTAQFNPYLFQSQAVCFNDSQSFFLDYPVYQDHTNDVYYSQKEEQFEEMPRKKQKLTRQSRLSAFKAEKKSSKQESQIQMELQPGEPRKRVSANKKERRRTQSINNAFNELRNRIPHVPSDTKLSKIKTLKLATKYIEYLMGVLEQNDPNLLSTGFKPDLGKLRRECRTKEIKMEVERKTIAKGRTGWPQDVWAKELKNEPMEVSNNNTNRKIHRKNRM